MIGPAICRRWIPLVLLCLPADAAISVSGLADKTKYTSSVSFTITADPNAATTTATLDGAAVAVNSPVTVSSVRHHELHIESRTAGNGLVDSKKPTRALLV